MTKVSQGATARISASDVSLVASSPSTGFTLPMYTVDRLIWESRIYVVLMGSITPTIYQAPTRDPIPTRYPATLRP
ncbi:hypothetical protein CcCBS67573_g00648 [Chytriomyces confervae]|uniref:Uncharacterized protein n=1 Tax=Chytriomyces confervae TaxID=246404 RepID=A0A507FP82_9FUNG|nr:hypothetical protein CcCBS67573_g00648 [Chytriomyces confervae]